MTAASLSSHKSEEYAQVLPPEGCAELNTTFLRGLPLRHLGIRVEKEALSGLVLEAVRRVPRKKLRPVTVLDAGYGFDSVVLLAILTYCYAQRICGSQSIEALMRKDMTFCELCGESIPSWRELDLFRRQNRRMVQRCLEHALRNQNGVVMGKSKAVAEALERIQLAEWLDSVAV